MKNVFNTLGPEGFGSYYVEFEGNQPKFERLSAATDRILVPGFVDIHIHGAFGIDFMSASPNDMGALCHRLKAEGYEGFLPTTVTASPEAIRLALSRLPEHPMIWGFHLEGPFISKVYPGAQPQEFIINPPAGPSEWDEILDDPRLRVVTMAPERPHALEMITRLMEQGVKVGIGHTNATYEEARRGFEFGATHTTHTFNAMRPFHHREAGTVGYGLQAEGLMCELIYDRLHVCRDSAALLVKCKSPNEILGISDGTMAAGVPAGAPLNMWGLDVVVGRGEVRLGDGTLAGSGVTLYKVFQNLWEDFGADLAIRACCINPRKLLGRTEPPRVWLELDRDLRIVSRLEPA